VRLHLHLPRALKRHLPALAAAGLLAVPAALGAQQRDTTRAAPPAAAPADTTRRAPAPSPADSARRAPAPADTAPRRNARRGRAAPVDTLRDSLSRPPISPRRALLYSLLVPGLGQQKLRRPRATALFSSIELGSWFMIAKSQNDLRIARAHRKDSTFAGTYQVDPKNPTDSIPVFTPDPLAVRIRSRRLHLEDWIAAVVFNHLFAGADAFVAAQLWDVPIQVSVRPLPRGVTASASIAW
jgi:hypothetical protein